MLMFSLSDIKLLNDHPHQLKINNGNVFTQLEEMATIHRSSATSTEVALVVLDLEVNSNHSWELYLKPAPCHTADNKIPSLSDSRLKATAWRLKIPGVEISNINNATFTLHRVTHW
jgi:hypothetical protein